MKTPPTGPPPAMGSIESGATAGSALQAASSGE
jgi:hypothetical protein